MAHVLLIGVGGFIGSVFRYWVGGYVQQLSKGVEFPYGTLAVNVIGCLLIGFLSQLAETRSVFTPETRLLVFVGILGGFTTFSAFGFESMNLFRGGNDFYALANVGAQVLLGLGAVWLGGATASSIWK